MPNTRSRWTEARDHALVVVRALGLVGALACAIAVGMAGELSAGALIAVSTAGAAVVVIALARRSGADAPPRTGKALPWVAVLAAVLGWEILALSTDLLPTVSDLADPVLADPFARGAATLCWLAGGAWLVARPRLPAMRTTPGRLAVLLAWLWVGVHFLAR